MRSFGGIKILGVLVALVFIVACASALKKKEDLLATPEDFAQKIEKIPMPETSQVSKGSPNSATHVSAKDTSIPSEAAQTLPSNGLPPQALHEKSVNSGAALSKSTSSGPNGSPKPSQSPPSSASLPSKKLTPEKNKKTPPETFSFEPQAWPFGIGEKITLVLRYGPLEGGIATMEVAPSEVVDGEPMIHFVGRVRSSKVLELFYKVDDTMESWVSISNHLTSRMEIEQIESNTWGRRVVIWDQKKNRARFYSNTTTKKDKGPREVRREDDIAPFAQDVFSALYFYRFVADGRSLNFPIHDRWKNWNNEMTFVGEERVQVPAGTFDTLKYKMLPRVQGNLEPKGDVEIWVMKDATRVLVQFKAKIKVGSVTGELKEYVPGSPLPWPPPKLKTPLIVKP